MLLLLARCDSLDPSSHPQLFVLLPMFKSPEMLNKIDQELSLLEQNEARQKRTIFSSVEVLNEQGYEVEYIIDLPMIKGLEELQRRELKLVILEIIELVYIDLFSICICN